MKSTGLIQLVDNLPGKIHNLYQVCGVSGCEDVDHMFSHSSHQMNFCAQSILTNDLSVCISKGYDELSEFHMHGL